MDSTKNNFHLVSYPKSGRTWLALMLSDYEIYPKLHHYKLISQQLSINWSEEHYKDLAFKTYNNNEKVVFLIRDPRDIVVSSYHHLVDRYNKNHLSDFKAFIRSPNTGLPKIIFYQLKIFNHTKTAEHPFLIVRYEELHRNPYQTMRHILNFYGKFTYTKETILENVSKRNFENMRKKEMEGGYKKNEIQYLDNIRDISNPNSFKVRQGKMGSYKDYFDDYDQAYFNNLVEKTKYPKTFLVD